MSAGGLHLAEAEGAGFAGEGIRRPFAAQARGGAGQDGGVPGVDAAGEDGDVGEPGRAQGAGGAGGAAARLAVQHERGVLRQRIPALLGHELGDGQQAGIRNRALGVLAGFAHVDHEKVVGAGSAGVEAGHELLGADFGQAARGQGGRLGVGGSGGGDFGCGRLGGDTGAQQRNLAEAAIERIDHEDAPDQRIADAGDELDRFGGHQRADLAAEGAEHAGVGAVGHLALGGRGGEQVAQVHTGQAAVGGRGRPEHRELGVESQHGCPHQRQPEGGAGVVHEKPGGEVVGAVDDHVVAADDLTRVRGDEALVVHDHGGFGGDFGDLLGGAVDLGAAHVGLAVHDLALQVAGLHVVAIDDADGADPGRGQVQQGGGAEAPGAEHEHPCVGQAALAQLVELGKPALTGGAHRFGSTETIDGRDKGRNGHGIRLAFSAPAAARPSPARPAAPGGPRGEFRKTGAEHHPSRLNSAASSVAAACFS